MEYSDSFESDDDAPGDEHAIDIAPSSAALLGQTTMSLDGEEYGAEEFEEDASSKDEYADETFELPPSPPCATKQNRAPGMAHTTPSLPFYHATKLEHVEGVERTSSSASDNSPTQFVPEWTKVNLQSFVATKLSKLRVHRHGDDDVSVVPSVRVPITLLDILQRPPPDGTRSGDRLRHQRQGSVPTSGIPAAMVDRVRIQTLLATMEAHVSSSGVASHADDVPTPRSLFTFVARHHSRLNDRRWAMQIDSLQAKQQQSHDTLGWIADHMQRHREAYTSV
ncbi:hypothetical protein H310_10996 [Aphanomyces invadans]|uniref:Uncharacterized protein n=1 Tax=Aphanomyces invadans TaxID=157072 RepID=A0A024TNH7_9STRA|nr:hypothetical protein H310_10996 [Aphanomyces invadans]ETV95554.1 hypothetical protein H310_10996 [Aphanomyces invadans]|eukprot:XP_008875747.1 hypothetical protein H310_10996 [Aphanomyces invadans]